MPATSTPTVTLPRPLPHQLSALFSPARYKVLVCGRRWGKTALGLIATVSGHGPQRSRRGAVQGARVWWVAPDYPTASEIWRDLRRACRSAGGDKSEVERRVELPTGGSVTVKSAHDPGSLVAVGLDGLVLDEAARLDERAWYESLRPTLSDRGGWVIMIGTPKGHNWFWELYEKARGQPDWETWQRPTADNPLIPTAELEAARRDSPRYFGQEYEAQFISVEGAEWPPEFFDRIFFTDWPPDLERRVLALDPSKGKQDRSGDYSAFVLLGLCRDWTLWADADLDAARPVESPRGGRSIVNDGLDLVQSWRPDAFSVETNGFQHLVAEAFLRVAGERRIHLPLFGVCSTSPKVSRIRALGPYLAQGRLRVRDTPGGRLLVQQLRDFPQGEHDDAPDALAQAVRMLDKLLGARGGADAPELVRG